MERDRMRERWADERRGEREMFQTAEVKERMNVI